MWEKCDMHALLKYAKNAAICEACGNRIYMKLTCLAVAIIPLQISTIISMSFTKCNSVFITKHFTSKANRYPHIYIYKTYIIKTRLEYIENNSNYRRFNSLK